MKVARADRRPGPRAQRAPAWRRATLPDRTVGATVPLAEVHDRFSAAYSLDPDVLGSGQVRVQVMRRDDHQCGERFVHTVPLPVEVCAHDDRVVVGHRILQRLPRGPGALESRGGDDFGGIPTNPLARLATREW